MTSKGLTRGKSDLRVGVIGAGVMGSNHARVLAQLPGVKLAGVADPLAESRSRVTGFVDCPIFETVDELLAAGVDAAMQRLAGLAYEVPPRILITGSLYLAGHVLAANGTPPG